MVANANSDSGVITDAWEALVANDYHVGNKCVELTETSHIPFNGIGVIPKRIYCLHQQCDLSWQILPGYLVRLFYSIAVILLILFFAWESAPWHATKLRESCFLIFILTIVSFTTLTADFHVDCWNIETLMYGYVMFMLVFCHIMRNYIHMRASSKFFSSSRCRQKVPRPRPNPSGLHAARKITSAIDRVTYSQEYSIKSDVILCLGIISSKMIRVLMQFDQTRFWRVVENGLRVEDDEIVSNYWWNIAIGLCFALVAAYVFRDAPMLMHMYEARSQVRTTISALVRSSDSDGLDYVLANVSVADMFYLSELPGFRSRYPSVLEQLVGEALDLELLDVTSKAIVLDGIMKRGLGLQSTQQVAKRVILSCRGLALTELKNVIDSGGDLYNFYKLVYIDLTTKAIQAEVLRHVAREAARLRQQRGTRVGIKVVSDVDDTILCSGGRPAGCDKQYPKKAIYPGVLTLYAALGQSATENACDVVFLSARPHIYKGMTEKHSHNLFRSLVDEGLMQGTPTLLPGRIAPSLKGALLSCVLGTRAWSSVGNLKFQTFVEFSQLYPEYDFVFSGDDGQGDLLAGQRMLRHAAPAEANGAVDTSDAETETGGEETSDADCEEVGGEVLAVLIHSVLPSKQRPLSLLQQKATRYYLGDAVDDLAWHGLIIGHRTFVGAAVELHEAELLPSAQLACVAAKAIEHFESMCVVFSDEWDEAAQARAERELRTDLDRAALALRKDGVGAKPLPRLRSIQEIMADRCAYRSDCAEWADDYARRASTRRA